VYPLSSFAASAEMFMHFGWNTAEQAQGRKQARCSQLWSTGEQESAGPCSPGAPAPAYCTLTEEALSSACALQVGCRGQGVSLGTG